MDMFLIHNTFYKRNIISAPKISLKITKRLVHTIINVSNALAIDFINQVRTDEGRMIMTYISDELRADVNSKFSEIIKNAPDVLGFHIHADSFLMELEDIFTIIYAKVPNPQVVIDRILSLDDVGLVDKEAYVVEGAIDIYNKFMYTEGLKRIPLYDRSPEILEEFKANVFAKLQVSAKDAMIESMRIKLEALERLKATAVEDIKALAEQATPVPALAPAPTLAPAPALELPAQELPNTSNDLLQEALEFLGSVPRLPTPKISESIPLRLTATTASSLVPSIPSPSISSPSVPFVPAPEVSNVLIESTASNIVPVPAPKASSVLIESIAPIADSIVPDQIFNNNNEIIILTVISFVVIVGIAIFVRKYYPESVKATDKLQDEDVNYNFFESFIDFSHILNKILLLLLPLALIIIYNLRYYYIYKLKSIFFK